MGQCEFTGWALIELFGRHKEIGFVTTQYYGTGVLFSCDTPELPERKFVLTAPEYINGTWTTAGAKVKRPASPAKSRLIGLGAIYILNPCTEEAARTALDVSQPKIMDSGEVQDGQVAEVDEDGEDNLD